jgi:hypothetical protein
VRYGVDVVLRFIPFLLSLKQFIIVRRVRILYKLLVKRVLSLIHQKTKCCVILKAKWFSDNIIASKSPHPNPLSEGEGIATPSPPGRGLG